MALPEGANDEPQGVYRKKMRHGGKSCPTRRDQLSSDLPGFRRNALPAGEDAIRHKLFCKKDLQILEVIFVAGLRRTPAAPNRGPDTFAVEWGGIPMAFA